eukprot:gb/GECG01000782.1/.p1 GENE.gb/GECG01000782.1/~~gb/GECG01000782.1/.p1  ORF type:complete len:120 (+),score=19.18 gb/GECG01000782.1/:1-360(+)
MMLTMRSMRASSLLPRKTLTTPSASMAPLANAVSGARFKTYDMQDRERALENRYFSMEDDRLLRKLLKKARAQAQESDPQAQKEAADVEDQELRKIVDKYQMSTEDVQALKDWRHSHAF